MSRTLVFCYCFKLVDFSLYSKHILLIVIVLRFLHKIISLGSYLLIGTYSVKFCCSVFLLLCYIIL